MASPRPWTVLAHEPIAKLEENLWAVAGSLPRGGLNRRMSIVRLSDGRLVFHNAVPLQEPSMRDLEAFGRPAILVVPNGFHRLDLQAWKRRYPDLSVICPRPARERVARVVAVDGSWDAFPRDPAVAALPLEGSKAEEAALVVRSAGGARVSLLFGDTIMNIPHRAGLEGLVLRLIGSSGGPKVTRLARLVSVGDRAALEIALLRLAAIPGLVRLVPSHGDLVTADAPAVLGGVAAALR